MRTMKSLALATNSGGQSKFVTSGGRTIDQQKQDEAKSHLPVMGSRSENSAVVIDKEIMIPDSVAQMIVDKRVQADTDATLETAEDISQNFGGGGLPGNTAVTDIVTSNMLIDVLSAVVTDKDPARPNVALHQIYRDMYYHDATSGMAIDLLSTIPFSDFTISGLRDEKIASKFTDSIESMNMNVLLPSISVDYLTIGSAIMSMVFDDSKGTFTGVSPHNQDFAVYEHIPIFGVDPEIKIQFPRELSTILNDPEKLNKYKEFLPKAMLDAETQGNSGNRTALKTFTLDPTSSVFIPRRALFKDYRGVSLLKRALPAWFYEKALIRGTLDQVNKRQRPTMHITAGDGDEWVPDSNEMSAIANLFLSADLDPLGAIVVTRNGVNVNEVRRGEDFWRWDSNFDVIEKIKLRAIGVSESFVTGDANYSTMEQTLSVFIEQIRSYRQLITREVFYDKMFPMIASKNGITKKRYGQHLSNREVARRGDSRLYYDSQHNLSAEIGAFGSRREYGSTDLRMDTSEYVIPEVNWHKRLMPEADKDYLDMLATLEEKGAPIPIRYWLSAGGIKYDKLIESHQEDIEARTKIAEWRKDIADINKTLAPQEEGGGGGDDDGEFAALSNFLIGQKLNAGTVRQTSILSKANPGHPNAELAVYDSKGRRRVQTQKGRAQNVERFNKKLAEAASNVAQQENRRIKAEAPEPSKKYYHSK